MDHITPHTSSCKS
ncbi:hypothetical protein BAE44_0012081 [Dichanthelium oligosanthes]|uniref:Uncharacterized protein n=1 Tax=Dichanthelium oligosanthes TaxID=888268 RepID=A0A1E5VP67_9POAL|nr:hypothetical protein BAE44_0012081 [Dichanthelium oligosanthes]